MDKIRIGLIGASVDATRSWGTRAHIPALKHLPQFELAALCTSRPETARAAGDAFGVGSVWHDPRRMAAEADIEAIAVSVRTPLHREMIEIALAAGKHVYCEWPLGRNTEEAEASCGLAERAGVVAMIGLQGAKNERFRFARDLIDDGYIGRPLAATLKLSQANFGPVETVGNAYTADLRNGADILRIATGQGLEAVCVLLGDLDDIAARVVRQHDSYRLEDGTGPFDKTAPDHVALMARTASGALFSAMIRGGVSPAAAEARLEINGTEGDLVLQAEGAANIHRAPVRVLGARRGEARLTELTLPGRYELQPEGLADGPARYLAHNYVDFAAAIRGGAPVTTDFAYGLRWHRMLDRIQAASDRAAQAEA